MTLLGKMKALLLILLLPTLAAGADGFLAKDKSEALDAILSATDKQAPNETDVAYRKRRAASFLAHDQAMKKEDVVRITGAIRHPGYIEIKPGMRVGDAIKRAGGFGTFALRRRVIVTRLYASEEKTSTRISFSSDIPTDREIADSPILNAGDRIYAPQEIY